MMKMNLHKTNNKVMSVAIVMCLMAVTIGGAVLTDEQEVEDSDGIVISGLIIGSLLFAGIIVAAFGTGMVIGDYFDPIFKDSSQSETYARTTEASTVASSILTGKQYWVNALSNYNEIWQLTDEHWIRQAELAASFLWSSTADFDPSKIMVYSETYQNCAYMLKNASAQFNEQLSTIGERVELWNNTDTYADQMTISWVYGNSNISSKTSFGGCCYTATTVSSESADTVFLTGGDLWVFGGSATITATDGTTITLQQGCNDLDSISTFKAGEYDLQTGRQYAGYMLPTMTSDSASVTTGMVIQAGSTTKLATYNPTSGKVVVDGTAYSSLSIKVTPDDGTSSSAEVTNVLSNYYALVSSMRSSIIQASNAAMTVWDIYDKAGSASSYLTTLTVPDNYDNVDITQAQQEVITILALEQLSEYYTANSGAIKTGDYKMSNESLTLYCRGDIYDENNKKLYSNVIFTPFFYHSDVTLNSGVNDLTQSCIVAIWSNDGTNLSGWDGNCDINTCSLITLSSGESLDIFEMMHGGDTVSTILLEQEGIDIIQAEEMDPTPNPTPGSDKDTNWVKIILLVVGILGIVLGLVFKRTDFVVMGIAAIVIGLLAGSWLWDLIT